MTAPIIIRTRWLSVAVVSTAEPVAAIHHGERNLLQLLWAMAFPRGLLNMIFPKFPQSATARFLLLAVKLILNVVSLIALSLSRRSGDFDRRLPCNVSQRGERRAATLPAVARWQHPAHRARTAKRPFQLQWCETQASFWGPYCWQMLWH